MFYVEEDIQPVVDAAERRLGRSGSMMHGKNVIQNVTLTTREFGTFWYGDYEGSSTELMKIIAELSEETGYHIQEIH